MEANAHVKNVNTQNVSERSFPIDLLKTICITAVVFIHGALLIPFVPSEFDFKHPERWIEISTHLLRFCVPVFIFLWAFFLEKSILKNGITVLTTRFIKLFIPFVLWTTIYFIYTADFKSLSIGSAISKYWLGYGWAGQYYFIILFQLMALFPVLRIMSKLLMNYLTLTYTLSIAVFLIACYTNIFDFGIVEKISQRAFVYWLPYAILGIINVHKNVFKSPAIYLLALLPISLTIEVFYLHLGDLRPYLTTTVFLSSIAILALLLDSKIVIRKNVWAVNMIQYISKNTLGVFCINPLVVITLGPAIQSTNLYFQFPGCGVVVPILSSLFVLIICLLLNQLLKTMKLGFLVSN